MGFDSDSEAATKVLDPLTLRARARVGTTLRGKWRLDVLLGVGGMAAVYAATHRNGTRAAVKLLHSELAINPQVRSRFLREGYVANAVGHDGAVKIIDDDTADDGSLFLVTELLDGETLEERRVRLGGRLSEDEVLSLADQLLNVLAAAHAKGVVHRDLKPENVFLTRAGVVKVLDFGIARLRELSTASTATKTGASMGTPAYMAPEQARGLWDEVDARSDLWAVGATMFHLLSGQMVHEGRTSNEMLLSAMTKPAQRLTTVAPSIMPAVTHVVDRALAFEPHKRWPDAQSMQEAVRRAYHDRFEAPLTTAPKLTIPPEVRNRTLASAPGALGPVLPTTGQPVASSRNATTALAGLSRRALAALVLGGAAACGIIITGVAVATSLSHRGTTPAASIEVLAVPAFRVAPPLLPVDAGQASSTVPEVAATDLPTSSAAGPAAAATRPPATETAPATIPPPPPALAAPATGRLKCNPPYTVDRATGKKTFKIECL